MKVVYFKLNEELREKDALGRDYTYKANEHPTIEDIIIVHFEEDGKEKQAYYQRNIVNRNFKDRSWIMVKKQ